MMLQKVNIKPAETFTLKSDGFGTTRYLDPSDKTFLKNQQNYVIQWPDSFLSDASLGWLLELPMWELVKQHSGSEST